ncbi:MAG TPA: DUF4129 domain-containing protein, partial [Pseudonocardia sp.]|nr:DUF4129 domain-containing protein [Pseudonocardia sp.]
AGAGALFAAGPRTSADHRAAADAHAARGEWDAAVRERFRAVVRDLEERELIDTRAGRTAGEAATDAGLVLPSCAADLHAAAGLFDEVVYGGRRAAQDGDARIRAVDDAVRRARPVPAR